MRSVEASKYCYRFLTFSFHTVIPHLKIMLMLRIVVVVVVVVVVIVVVVVVVLYLL